MTEQPGVAKKVKKNWLQRNWSTLLVWIAFFIGLILLIYPSFADYWNSFHQTRAIMSYSTAVSEMSSEQYDDIINQALEYNAELSRTGVNWHMSEQEKKKYESVLNITGNGNMGYIRIEKIGVTLPLYHGTSESVLQTSIGHIAGTSLPVGARSYDSESGMVKDSADGSHCVLSGHRGLPSAKLFSDLDKLVEGDTFCLNVLGETYTYQIDQVRVVEPTDLSDLVIEPGQDYCTLVTCTPYGINTHRLLVRGHRIANPQGDIAVVSEAMMIDSIYVAPFIAAPIILLLLIWVFIDGITRKTYQ